MNYYNRVNVKGIFLKKGRYTIKIKFDSKVSSVAGYEDLHKFNPSEVNTLEFVEDVYEDNSGYSAYDKI